MTDAFEQYVGQYRLLEELGQGGMGTVYLAAHVETGAHVAIKTVRHLRAAHLTQIRREIYVLSQLKHPGVVSIIEHGLVGGTPWYAMDFVRGVTLRHYSRGATPVKYGEAEEPDTLYDMFESATMILDEDEEDEEALATSLMLPPSQPGGWWSYTLGQDGEGSQFPPAHLTLEGLSPTDRVQRILQLLRRLCISLGYLHGKGLVHCDLKPGNILVREDGWPVLIDFGLLMQFSGQKGRESIDAQRRGQGTPAYMSPEQIEGSLLDARADLYSLGCILYELLTGRPPFVGSHEEILAQHMREIPAPPSHLAEAVPPAVDQMLLRLLAKKPQERIGYTDTLRHLLGKLVPPDKDTPEDWRGALDEPMQFYLYRPGFVSRPSLLPQMERLLQEMGDDPREETSSARIWVLEGESGVGKTRMFLELARLGAARGRQVLTGECLDHHSPPFEGFLSTLRAMAVHCQAKGEAETVRLLGTFGRALLAYEPMLYEIPGVGALPPLPELPPNQMRDLVHQALHHALAAYSADKKLMVMLDDIQWADALTLGFLHYIQTAPRLTNVLFLGAYRSEEINESIVRLRSHSSTEILTLERFNEEGVGLLVKDMLALPSSPRKFSQFLATHSEGNPFFVAEYLRAAVESGMLWRHPQGRWHIGTKGLATDLDPDEESLPLPDSLRALVAHRLSDLTPGASALMAAAAVIERDITYRMLEVLTLLAQHELWSALEELQRKQILLTSPENTLRFAHNKLQEVAYDNLEESHRMGLHRRAAEALEADQSPAQFEALARHWQRAGEQIRALSYYKQAAKLSEQQYDNEQAIRLYRTYIELDPHPTAETIELYLAMGNVQRLIGNVEDAETSFKQSWALARQLGVQDLEGQSQSSLGLLYRTLGRADESLKAHKSALSLYRQVGNRASEGATLGDMATNHMLGSELEAARLLFAEALAIHYETGNHQAQAKDMGNLAGVHLQLNEFQTARQLYEAALLLLERFGPERYRPQMLNNLAHVYECQQNLDKAQALYEQTFDLATAHGNRRSAGMALGNRAMILRDRGALEEARAAFSEAIQIHRAVGNIMFEAVDWIQQLVMDRLTGQNVLALKASLHNIEMLLRNASDKPHMALLLCELGHIQLAQGFDANDRLEAALRLGANAQVDTDSPTKLGVALARLQHAQEAVSAGETLFRGQRIEDIPPGFLARLQRDGHLPGAAPDTPVTPTKIPGH